LTIFRSTLVPGDSDRNWSGVWDRGGGLLPSWTFAGRPVTPFQLSTIPLPQQWWDSPFHGGFRLPPNTTPGTYKLNPGGGDVDIRVIAAPKRSLVTIKPGHGTAAAVRAAVSRTVPVEITLEPGFHVWEAPVSFPDWVTVRADGATVLVVPNPGLNGYANVMMVPGHYFSWYGGTIVGEMPARVFHLDTLNNPVRVGGVVADVTIRRCNLSWGFADLLCRDVRFVNAGAAQTSPGMYLRCTWDGISPEFTHAFRYGGDAKLTNGGTLALIDLEFRNTDRGLCFYTTGGAITGGLFLNVAIRDVDHAPSDGECFLVEGDKAFDNNLILRLRSTGSRGSILQLDRVARGNLIRELSQDSYGRGVVLGSPWTTEPGKDVSRNEFVQAELRGGAFRAGPAVVNNTLDGIIMRPTEGVP
jgi:hypothetical protein